MTGVLINSLGSNQLAFQLLSQANKSNSKIGVFSNDTLNPCLPVQCFLSTLDDAVFCPELIATNLELAHYMLTLGPKQRALLVWDLEWMRNRDYNYTSKIYNDASIRMLVRSESHKRAFESVWNRQAEIFNWEKI